jgi:hypothetical protein
MNTILKIFVSVIAFAVASGATYLVVRKRNVVQPVNLVKRQQDTIEGVLGEKQ